MGNLTDVCLSVCGAGPAGEQSINGVRRSSQVGPGERQRAEGQGGGLRAGGAVRGR